jgi:hypothetical protein
MGEARDALTTPPVAASRRRIEELRAQISTRVDELAERRRRWTDWRLQVREHPRIVVAGVVVAVLTVGLIVRASRRRASVEHWARALRQIRLAVAHPERLPEGRPSRARKLAEAAAAGAAGMAARELVKRYAGAVT